MDWRWKVKVTIKLKQSRCTLSSHFRKSLQICARWTGTKMQPKTEENWMGTAVFIALSCGPMGLSGEPVVWAHCSPLLVRWEAGPCSVGRRRRGTGGCGEQGSKVDCAFMLEASVGSLKHHPGLRRKWRLIFCDDSCRMRQRDQRENIKERGKSWRQSPGKDLGQAEMVKKLRGPLEAGCTGRRVSSEEGPWM